MPVATAARDQARDHERGPDLGPYAPGDDFDTEPDDSEDEAIPREPAEADWLNPGIRPIFVAVILIILMFFFTLTTVVTRQLL